MKVIVVGDVHLKPEIFSKVSEVKKKEKIEKCVFLGDFVDDWGKKNDIEAYNKTFEKMKDFVNTHPKTLWCYGNHDLSYRWHELESGYSARAENFILKEQLEVNKLLGTENAIKYVHKIDNVLFSHAGISKMFVNEYICKSNDIDEIQYVVDEINKMTKKEMWNDGSPIWLRPQIYDVEMYKSDSVLQVVGHTPVEKIERKNNLISCDVFSTYCDGRPIGTEEIMILDTKSWEFEGVKI